MKNKLLKSLLALLIIPALLFVGCKKKEISAINISNYFKNELTVKRFNVAETSTDTLALLTQSKAVTENLSKYTKFEFSAQPVWAYKMYIDSVSFYVYTNESSDYQMILNLKITNLATEQDLKASTNESTETSDFEDQIPIIPKAKKAIKCEFKIGKTIATATGSTFSIDILNSLELFSASEEESSSFNWLIYGLEIHGESRSYS